MWRDRSRMALTVTHDVISHVTWAVMCDMISHVRRDQSCDMTVMCGVLWEWGNLSWVRQSDQLYRHKSFSPVCVPVSKAECLCISRLECYVYLVTRINFLVIKTVRLFNPTFYILMKSSTGLGRLSVRGIILLWKSELLSLNGYWTI